MKYIFLILTLITSYNLYGQSVSTSESEALWESAVKKWDNDKQGSINDFSKYIKLRPDIAGAYYNRGLLYIQTENYRASTKEFDKAIELDNNYINAYYQRGRAYNIMNMASKGISDLKYFLDNKDFSEDKNFELYAFEILAQLYLKNGEPRKAIEEYSNIIFSKPVPPVLLNNTYYNLGHIKLKNKISGGCNDLMESYKVWTSNLSNGSTWDRNYKSAGIIDDLYNNKCMSYSNYRLYVKELKKIYKKKY